jgi:2,3-bisphosphoglycerate-dependent phosphoglycerate mutase
MAKLILLRHFKSQWNLENRFAGWVDNPLSEEGIKESENIAELFSGTDIDAVYTSPLSRNHQTVLRTFRLIGKKYPIFRYFDGKMQKWSNFEGNGNYVPAYVSEALNERYYGELQGLNKEETIKKYGQDQVHLWRRSYDIAPPGGESLKDVYKRAVPFFVKYAQKDLKDGKNVLVVASHNSLRALVKYIENISDEGVADLELPFGALIKYDFDGKNYVKT